MARNGPEYDPRQATVRDSYRVTATSVAPPSRLWSLLVDAHSWPRWGTVDALVTEQSSPNGLDTVGAVRAFRTGSVVTSERIVDLRPPEAFTYEGVSNPVLTNYRAEILLTEEPGGGTLVTWHGSYDVATDLHLIMRRTMAETMRSMAEGLAREAAISAGTVRPGASPLRRRS
ncbi:SRPBCC family protein [Phytohabitans flavus]|uniref:ATPase n=1 Tax=Phytohabitans flavus TaxID=1076124 RepID=A0A6F8XWW1_9ACTN|nr:SRPBCC family protein [Phytohabitans flavus]BCB78326.1 ATPase [Phytohabitans flavus]